MPAPQARRVPKGASAGVVFGEGNIMSGKGADSAYEILPPNSFFEANRSIVNYEVRKIVGITFSAEVDLSQVERIRAAMGENKPSYTAFVAKALALALLEFPYANRRVCRRLGWPLLRARLQQFNRCDIAIACERSDVGHESVAFADILRDVDRLSLLQINHWLQALSAAEVSSNKQWRDFSRIVTRLPHWLSTLLLRMPCFSPLLWVKYRGGAALISSPAKYGVDGIAATWCWPLGVSFGMVKRRPVVRGSEIVACPTFSLVLTFDRCVMAGAQAARFFKRIVDVLEKAETEMAPYLPARAAPQLENCPR